MFFDFTFLILYQKEGPWHNWNTVHPFCTGFHHSVTTPSYDLVLEKLPPASTWNFPWDIRKFRYLGQVATSFSRNYPQQIISEYWWLWTATVGSHITLNSHNLKKLIKSTSFHYCEGRIAEQQHLWNANAHGSIVPCTPVFVFLKELPPASIQNFPWNIRKIRCWW